MKLKINRKDNMVDLLIVLSAFLIYFIWSVFLPADKAPDEGMRFLVPEYIFKNGCLPVGDDPQIRDDIWGFSYAFTPYGSSLLSVCFMKIAALFSQKEAVLYIASRMISVFAGTGTTIFCLRIGKLAFEKKTLRWTFAVFTSFLPQFVFLSSYFNSDSFAVLTCTAIFYYWLRGLRDGWDVKSCLGLGIWIGLCALSYYNAYGYILCSVIIFCASILSRKQEKKENIKFLIKMGFFIFLVAFVIAGWFFVRNFILYHGDFLGMDSMYACGEKFGQEKYRLSNRLTFKNQSKSVVDMLLHTTWIPRTACSFFAVFGYADIYVSAIFYVIYLVLLVLGIVMGIKAIVSAKEYAHHKLFLANGLLAIVVPVILSIHYSYAYDYQAQGRYVMPVLPIIMFLAAIGFGKAEACFSKKYFKVSGITALLWVFLFISILLTTIVPHCMAVPAGI